jgi:hypothetical protein
MKIIEQDGFAHRRSRLTWTGSDRNAAAWAAMKASRGFPPCSWCHRVSARSPASVTSNRGLVGADCMKKLRSDTAACGTGQLAQGPNVRNVAIRYACSLGLPPSLRVTIRREEIFRRRRSGRRDGIDEIHGDNRLAGHREAPATRNANGHIASIGIRNFDKFHEFFETFAPLPRAKVMCQARCYALEAGA